MAGWGLGNNDIEFISSQHAPAVSYIHQTRRTAGVEEKHGGKHKLLLGTCSIYLPTSFFYIHFPLLGPSFSHLISCSPFSAVACFNTSILYSSIFLTHPQSLPQTLPPSLSLFLPGGEHNLISHCWMRRPLLSGSRWWNIRPFGLDSFCIHTALLAAREHQITLNLGSITPSILNGRLI